MAKLKKFNISYTETVYYLTTEIKAKNKEQAEEEFMKKFDEGNIVVNESECQSIKIEEVK